MNGGDFTQIFQGLKKFFASKIPLRRTLPELTYNHVLKRKTTLPKVPTTRQLRNFSRDPVVRRAITVVQDALSRQEYVVEILGDTRRKYAKEIAAVKAVIESPNIIDSRESFIKRIIDDAMVLDAMAVEVMPASDASHPFYLYPVDGGTLQPVVPFDYADRNAARFAQQQGTETRYFTSKEIAYLQRNYFTYNAYGLSPVMMAYQYILYYLDAIERSNDKAVNMTSEFLISLGEGVTEEQRKRFEEYVREEIEGTGKIAIVAGASNVETKQVRAINGDILSVEWIERLTQIIGAAFGIPPEKLGIIIANDRSTGQDQENATIQDVIKPYASMVETLINNYVIGGMGLSGVLRFRFIFEDSEAQKSVRSKRVIEEYYRGAITENEFRGLMGYRASTSPYADMTYPEKTVKINVDNGVINTGFNGVGQIKDTSGGDKA